MINYTSCPVCGSSRISPVFAVTDYTVSRQSFPIEECLDCSVRFTQGVPGPDEMAPYYHAESYISHSDSRKGLINRLYHFARKITLYQKKKIIANATGLQDGRLLDVGAGTGAFMQYMHTAGWDVTGLEPDLKARHNANEINGVRLLPMTELENFSANTFDVITLWHVLEHVHHLYDYLKNLKNIMKPGGALFIAVPNYTSYDASTYLTYWAAYDVPRHLYHFSPNSMRMLLAAQELKLQKVKPLWLDSFYISLLSEKYEAGHDRLVRAFLQGAKSNLKAWFNNEKCSSLIYIARQLQPLP